MTVISQQSDKSTEMKKKTKKKTTHTSWLWHLSQQTLMFRMFRTVSLGIEFRSKLSHLLSCTTHCEEVLLEPFCCVQCVMQNDAFFLTLRRSSRNDIAWISKPSPTAGVSICSRWRQRNVKFKSDPDVKSPLDRSVITNLMIQHKRVRYVNPPIFTFKKKRKEVLKRTELTLNSEVVRCFFLLLGLCARNKCCVSLTGNWELNCKF